VSYIIVNYRPGYCQRSGARPNNRALSRHLRGGFVSRLRQQIQDRKLPRIEDPAQIGALLDTLMAADWVVYSKPCLTHTETVVDYLARYSHRIALTDGRIVNRDGDRVQLDYKDYATATATRS